MSTTSKTEYKTVEITFKNGKKYKYDSIEEALHFCDIKDISLISVEEGVKIDIKKKYITRKDGDPVELIYDKGHKHWEVVGYIDGSGIPAVWDIWGNWVAGGNSLLTGNRDPHELDLIPVPIEPRKEMHYFNFYKDGRVHHFLTKEEAFCDVTSEKKKNIVKIAVPLLIEWENET